MWLYVIAVWILCAALGLMFMIGASIASHDEDDT